MKQDTIHVGDFVYCRSKHYRDSLQLPKELGLVIEIKRNNLKVLYPHDQRCWLPRETVSRMKPNLDYSTFLQRLYYILKKVHALECELVNKAGVHHLSVRIDRMDHDTVDDLRQFLDKSFISLVVVPEGMAFMQVEIVFRQSD